MAVHVLTTNLGFAIAREGVSPDRPIRPIEQPVRLLPDEHRYVHFGTLSALPGDRLVYVGQRGIGHSVAEGPSDIFAQTSLDGGRSWSSPVILAEGLRSDRRNRAPVSGTMVNGRVIAIYLDGPTGKGGAWKLVQRTSRDGVHWDPAREVMIEGGNPSAPNSSQMMVYGPIERIGSQLMAMAYLGPLNWAMTSMDDGRTWRLNSVLDTRQDPMAGTSTGISEIGFEPLSDGRIYAVARIDGIRSSMMQIVRSAPKGPGSRSWLTAGPLPLRPTGGYVSPDIIRIPAATAGTQRDVLLLFVMERVSLGKGNGHLRILCAPVPNAAETVGNSPDWRSVGELQGGGGDFMWRSGYSTAQLIKGELVLVVHDEVSASEAVPYSLRLRPRDVVMYRGRSICGESG